MHFFFFLLALTAAARRLCRSSRANAQTLVGSIRAFESDTVNHECSVGRFSVVRVAGDVALMSDDYFSSEPLLLSSEDGSDTEESAACPLEPTVALEISPLDYPGSGVLLCQNWTGRAHPVRPCQVLASDAGVHGCLFRFTFRNRKVVTVEKFTDGTFEYSFAYDYWSSGSIKSVVSTRALLGVLLEEIDPV
jgi:hypothetical protein